MSGRKKSDQLSVGRFSEAAYGLLRSYSVIACVYLMRCLETAFCLFTGDRVYLGRHSFCLFYCWCFCCCCCNCCSSILSGFRGFGYSLYLLEQHFFKNLGLGTPSTNMGVCLLFEKILTSGVAN